MFDFDEKTTPIFMDFKAFRIDIDVRKRKEESKLKREDKDGRGYDPVHGLLESAGRSCCQRRANKKEVKGFKLHTFMLSCAALSGCGRYLSLIIVLEGRTTFFRIPSIAGLVVILVAIATALALGRCALWARAA